MTKKDFQMVADVIRSYPEHSPNLRDAKVSFARSFAERFAQVNPRFDLARFAAACGLETYHNVIVYRAADYQ